MRAPAPCALLEPCALRALAPGDLVEPCAPRDRASAGRRELVEGRLVATFACDADWPHWEMHPHGEEVLVLLAGTMTMVLDDGGKEARVKLTAGRGCIVPRGVWHRAEVSEPGRLLGITYGRGTTHRPR